MKLVLLGLSGSGKSTVAPGLGRALGLELLEIDDETTRLNGGTWPKSEALIDALFERIVPRVLQMDAVLFVTSWLDPEEITAFYEHGFAIVELHATFEELVNRKLGRGDALEDGRMDKNYPIYQDILRDATTQGLLHLSLETTGLSPAEVEQAIIAALDAR